MDERGRPVETLRGTYETGDNDGEGGGFGISAIDREGYRNFKVKRVMQSWNEITDFDEPGEFKPGFKKRQNPSSIVPLSMVPRAHGIGGHTTIYGHEFVPHTSTNALLTQNPTRDGKVDGGCGENKSRYYSPDFHPISFKESYEYWDECQYPSSKLVDSLDTFSLSWEIEHQCPETGKYFWGNIVYVNPYNGQTYLWCPFCSKVDEKRKKHKQWHQIKDPQIIEGIGEELGIKLIRYNKLDTEAKILELVNDSPGINRYQLAQDLQMTKGMVNRGIDRLKEKHLVRTKTVRKAICVYPISEK